MLLARFAEDRSIPKKDLTTNLFDQDYFASPLRLGSLG